MIAHCEDEDEFSILFVCKFVSKTSSSTTVLYNEYPYVKSRLSSFKNGAVAKRDRKPFNLFDRLPGKLRNQFLSILIIIINEKR